MAIHFVCPYGHRLKVPDHRAGKRGRCPTCQQRVIVPVPNPIPSGREKRDWDASAADRIELDDAPSGPTLPAAPESNVEIESAPEAAPSAISKAESSSPPSPSQPGSSRIVADIALPEELVASSLSPSPPPPKQSISASSALPEVPAAEAQTPFPPMADTTFPPPPPPPPPLVPLPQQSLMQTESTPAADVSIEISTARPGFEAAPVSAAAPNEVGVGRSMPRWIAWADEKLIARVYRANPQQIETAYWLAVVLMFVIVFAAAPSLAYLQLDQAPGWAQIMLLLAGMQLAYAVWLMIVPDWSSVRIGMWVFGVSAAVYGAGMGLFALSSQGSPPLGLTASTASASGWCGAIVLVLGLLSYACGQVSSNWRRADLTASRRTV